MPVDQPASSVFGPTPKADNWEQRRDNNNAVRVLRNRVHDAVKQWYDDFGGTPGLLRNIKFKVELSFYEESHDV